MHSTDTLHQVKRYMYISPKRYKAAIKKLIVNAKGKSVGTGYKPVLLTIWHFAQKCFRIVDMVHGYFQIMTIT